MDVTIPPLSPTADPRDARHWVRQVVAAIGPGFHFDTPASEYLSADGRSLLSGGRARRLDAGLRRARRILGSSRFETLCRDSCWAALGCRYDRRRDMLVVHTVTATHAGA
jgi:hypothetical protein